MCPASVGQYLTRQRKACVTRRLRLRRRLRRFSYRGPRLDRIVSFLGTSFLRMCALLFPLLPPFWQWGRHVQLPAVPRIR